MGFSPFGNTTNKIDFDFERNKREVVNKSAISKDSKMTLVNQLNAAELVKQFKILQET